MKRFSLFFIAILMSVGCYAVKPDYATRPNFPCPSCGAMREDQDVGRGFLHMRHTYWKWTKVEEFRDQDYVLLYGEQVRGAKPIRVYWVWTCSSCGYRSDLENVKGYEK